MEKTLRKLICTFLIIVCFIAMNTRIYAITESPEPTKTESDIVCELSARRDAFGKCFYLQDGNYLYAQYPYQVNYFNGDFWEEIDNSLYESNGRITNSFDDFKLNFASSFISDSLVSIESNNHIVSWNINAFNSNDVQIEKSSQSVAVVQNNKTDRELTYNDKIICETKNISSLKYKNAFNETSPVDIGYTVFPYALKEYVVINKPFDIDKIVYTVNTKDLTCYVNDDNSIFFVDANGEIIYKLSRAYAYDDNDEYTYNISVSVSQMDDGYEICYTLDHEWMTSSDRAYPITIDPTVTASQAITNYEDTYVCVGDIVGAYNNEIKMKAGNKDNLDYRAFFKFKQLPLLLNTTHITLVSAKLKLFLPTATSTVNPLSIYEVNSTWTESTICHYSQPSSTLIEQNVNINNSNHTVTFNVLPYIYDYQTTNSNYGFMIKYTDDTINDYNAFYTSNYTNAACYPALTIVFNTNSAPEPNDTIYQATEVITDNEPGVMVHKVGSLSSVADVDYYKFVPQRQGVYVFELISPQGYNYSAEFYCLAPGSTTPTLVTPVSTINGCNAFFIQKGDDGSADLSEYYVKIYTVGNTVSQYSYSIYGYYSDDFSNLDWQYPLPTQWYRLSSAVGYRTYNNQFHKGIDIPANQGTQIKSVCAGTVKKSEWDEYGVMGYYVKIESAETSNYPVANSGNHYIIRYMHMNSEPLVSENDTVNKGTLLGYVGTTGSSSGYHLHIDIRIEYVNDSDDYIHYINPTDVFWNDINFVGVIY